MTDLQTRVEQAAQTQSNRPGHDYLVNDLWREILSLRARLAAFEAAGANQIARAAGPQRETPETSAF